MERTFTFDYLELSLIKSILSDELENRKRLFDKHPDGVFQNPKLDAYFEKGLVDLQSLIDKISS